MRGGEKAGEKAGERAGEGGVYYFTDCKLVLLRRPLDAGGSTVDSEDDKNRLPFGTIKCPDIGVSVLER